MYSRHTADDYHKTLVNLKAKYLVAARMWCFQQSRGWVWVYFVNSFSFDIYFTKPTKIVQNLNLHFYFLTFQVMDVLWSTTGMLKSLIWKTRGIRCVENCLVKDTIFQKSLTHTHSSEYLEMKNIVFWRSKFVTLITCVVH